jgi:putative ABC transport system permease protein
MYLMIFGGMTCVAAVALLVAAVGIANTMLMSVLERTREIGIMKAVGASSGQLQFIFLLEGAIIGLIGGVVGLLSAWAASFPGDAWLRSMVSRDLKIELKETIFVFPPWVILVVISFAVVVTTLAAVYPARRAARIDPVAALRHE